MYSYIDKDKLKNILVDFFKITHLRITVFDINFHEIMGYPEQRSLLCSYIRGNKAVDRACVECDKKSCEIAKEMTTPYVYSCHVGLKEIICPIVLKKNVVGFIFFAHIFSFENYQEGIDLILKNLSSYDLDKTVVQELCKDLPLTTEDFVLSASRLLQAVASYLYIEQIAYMKYENLAIKIDKYIHENYDKNINANTIAYTFGVGRTKLYSIAKEMYNQGIAEKIRSLRIEKAKLLLSKNTDVTIQELSGLCGFDDYNYFIACFKKIEGVSPKKYQKLIYK